MDANKVRIDASLHPVDSPALGPVEEFFSLLSDGFYDDAHPVDLDRWITIVQRSKLLENGRFNGALNKVLKSYGLYVVTVGSSVPEHALAYGSDYSMEPALEQALAMRAWFLPAMCSLYKPESALMINVIALLPETTRRTERVLCV